MGDATPARIGRYEILEVLGEGAMGVVHRARDPELGRDVALKVLRAGEAAPRPMIERFHREAQNAAKLSHPNLVRIYEAGRDGETLYIAMEYIAGPPLSAWQVRSKPTRRAVVEMVERCARAVQAAHERGIVHRDLKPGNILVDAAGQPHVVDFGLSHAQVSDHALTRSGAVMGTPLYMAPEQVRGAVRETDARTDVYALGVILYELLAGHVPFTGRSCTEVYRGILNDEPPRLRGVAPDLEAVCFKAIEKNREHRYAGCDAFADDLRRWLAEEPVVATGGVGARRFGRRILQRKWAIVAAAIVALLGTGLGVLWVRLRELEARSLDLMRRTARLTLEQALEWRREGHPEKGRGLHEELERACADVVREAPSLAEPHYHLARLHRALQREAEAMKELELGLAKDPRDANLRYERGLWRARRYRERIQECAQDRSRRLPRSAGDPQRPSRAALEDDVARELKRLARADLDGLTDPMARGVAAWLAGSHEEAATLLGEAIVASPKSVEAWEWKAAVTFHELRLAETLDLWTRAIEVDRGYAPFWEGRGTTRNARASTQPIADRERDLEAAIQDIDEALRLAPGRARTYLQRAVARQALAETRRGPTLLDMYERARSDFSEAIRLDGDSWAAWLSRAFLQFNWAMEVRSLGEDPTELLRAAESDYAEAGRIDPTSGWSHTGRGLVRRALAERLEARREDASALYAQALADMNEGVRLEPGLVLTWEARGSLHFRLGNRAKGRQEDATPHYEAAVSDCDAALRVDPAWADAWAVRGGTRANWGNLVKGRGQDPQALYREAIVDLTRAIDLNPAHRDAREFRGNAHLMSARWRLARGEEARDHARAALDDYTDVVTRLPARAAALQPLIDECRRLAGPRAP